MTTLIIKCWELQRWDGGERTNHYAYFSSEKEANSLKGQGDYITERTFVIHDTKQECLDFKSGETKRIAMQKLKGVLSDTELAALGIKD